MIMVTVTIHVAALMSLALSLNHAAPRFDGLTKPVKAVVLIVPSVLLLLFLHVAEAWIWAVLFVYLGEFSGLEEALYFSTVTATTLGYGDITLSEKWRLLGAFEAMGGLILFAASAAFLLALMRKVFEGTLGK